MNAVFITGGKQYRVAAGDRLRVERLSADERSVDFDTVVLLSDGESVQVGTPYVSGGKVSATVTARKATRSRSSSSAP